MRPTVSSSRSFLSTGFTAPTPLGYVTQLTYNARMQLDKVKDARNQEYTFTYDPLGRVLTQSPRVGTTPMSYGYDEVGNRTSRTDYNGNTTSYIYDSLNRLTNINYTGASSENVTYAYDDVSRLISAVNQSGTVAFPYDNRGRVASETDVFEHVMGFGYDPAGNRTGLSLDSNPYTTYAHDDANRLTTLTDAESNTFNFGYDDANRLISKSMPNGITSSFQYDGMSRLKRLKHEDSGSTALYDDQYEYNNANQIYQIAGLAGTKTFTYDDINRLTGMTNGTNTETYTYDSVGNRTMTGYVTGAFNRLTATGSESYNYNDNGSLTNSSLANYQWDRENRLVNIRRSDNMQFKYDALGRRVSSLFNPFQATLEAPVPERYTYDGLDVILDDNTDSNRPNVNYQNAPGIDNKLALTNDGRWNYFLQDHLGSTIGVTDQTGAVTESNSYDSFGNPSNSSLSTRYQFTGREFDSFSGLQYSRARFYDPQIGRFISEDPIGFGGGDVNLYGYVKNRPLKYRDPRGLDDADREFENRIKPPSPPYNSWHDGHNEYADNPFFPPINLPRPPTADLGARDAGFHAENRYFPKSGLPNDPNQNPYRGGYRHCVSACFLGKRYGPTAGGVTVWLYDKFHENPNDPSGDSQSDMRAEQQGLACAVYSNGNESVCEIECLKRYPQY